MLMPDIRAAVFTVIEPTLVFDYDFHPLRRMLVWEL